MDTREAALLDAFEAVMDEPLGVLLNVEVEADSGAVPDCTPLKEIVASFLDEHPDADAAQLGKHMITMGTMGVPSPEEGVSEIYVSDEIITDVVLRTIGGLVMDYRDQLERDFAN